MAHGEAKAILAAFALLNRAFEMLAEGWPGAPAAAPRAGLARDLARAVGVDGMIAGQARDLSMTEPGHRLPRPWSSSTAARRARSSWPRGRWARRRPGPPRRRRRRSTAYAKNLGLAFQIVDDLIDATGAAARRARTWARTEEDDLRLVLGRATARGSSRGSSSQASQEALAGFGARAQPLRDLARYVVARGRR